MARWMSGALAALAVVLALWFGLGWLSGPDRPPSDAEMIENLTRNRAGFDRLVAMIAENPGLARVDTDWTRPADPASIGVSPERIAAYRRLMTELGVPRGFETVAGGETIHFLAFASGLSIGGRGKSYVWSRSGRFRDVTMASDLDALWERRRGVWAYRHVQGPWYLHLDIN
jgi:hypothetical protein